MGVGGREMKTIGYTCRSVALKIFGPGFNSRRLHQPSPLVIRPRGSRIRVDNCSSTDVDAMVSLQFSTRQFPVMKPVGPHGQPQLTIRPRCLSMTLVAALDASFVSMILGTLHQ